MRVHGVLRKEGYTYYGWATLPITHYINIYLKGVKPWPKVSPSSNGSLDIALPNTQLKWKLRYSPAQYPAQMED